jgi:hypothetical protein
MRRRNLTVLALMIGVVLIAGTGFVYKMTEFAVTISRGEVEGFGAVAVATYLIGMLPIVCIALWATLTGRFRDIERPKVRMLELQDEIDRELARGRVGQHV